MLQIAGRVGQPRVVGFQADMAHTLLYVLGYNAPETPHCAGEVQLGAGQIPQPP
jgi:hypothetical protein